MNNKLKKIQEYNKIIEHMQQRYENTQYYRTILAECNNNLDKAINELIGIFEYELEENSNDILYNNMIAYYIKTLKN